MAGMNMGMGMSMDMWGGSGGKPKQMQVMRMQLAPRLRSKPLAKKVRKRLYRFEGKTIKQ
ncbi:MAG: hypothetical protein RL235_80 [Chlamydiota bacterium]|jgi:hypothetical protein